MMLSLMLALDLPIDGLYQTAHAQVLLDDDVVDGSHDESDLHGVCGACEMGVDLLRGVLVKPGESMLAYLCIHLPGGNNALTQRIG